MTDLNKMIREIRLDYAIAKGHDRDYIETLDYWLSEWLYKKNQCPKCSDESSVRYGYMCKTDYEYEVGHARGGNLVYASEEELKKEKLCVFTCGIVKVRIELEEVILKEDLEER